MVIEVPSIISPKENPQKKSTIKFNNTFCNTRVRVTTPILYK